MAAPNQPNPEAAPEATPPPGSSAAPKWRDLWQIPAILISGGLIAGGFMIMRQRAPQNDFEGAIAQIEESIVAEQYDFAEQRIRVVEDYLRDADETVQARYHAAVADLLAGRLREKELPDPISLAEVVRQYQAAISMGMELGPERLDRLATAQVDLGDIGAAKITLEHLTQIAGAGSGIARRREGIVRRMIERTMGSDTPGRDTAVMLLLDEYRRMPDLNGGDHAWAAGRQAEIRVRQGQRQEAINRLLVDMRRIEGMSGPDDDARIGELYQILGEAYYQVGEEDAAAQQLARSMELIRANVPIRGDAMVLLARIAFSRGEVDDAVARYDEVLAGFQETPAWLAAQFGRAEALGSRGDHAESREAFAEVVDSIVRSGPKPGVEIDRVTASLIDRHDAAVAIGAFETAIGYLELAERLYTTERAPADVLRRLADSNRALAADLVERAAGGKPADERTTADLDLALTEQSNRALKRAGDYYQAYGLRVASDPERGGEWSEATWMSADSFDRAGWHDLAIVGFRAYVEARSVSDPRQAEALLRLGLACRAEGDPQSAVTWLERLIRDQSRSPFAARAYVPLALCQRSMGKSAEAEETLRDVIEGRTGLNPASTDYRDALIEYGTLLHASEKWPRAIEALDLALQRYPTDPRINEVRFRLADSYRALAEQLSSVDGTPQARRGAETDRMSSLERALGLFNTVIERYDAVDPRRLDELQAEYQRDAWLLRGDCAFAMGRYEQSIDLYDQAERRYSTHPASLTALIQIVNACYALGDLDRARAAHRRAEIRLAQLPDSAFEGAASIFDRASWERWLRNSPVGSVSTQASAGASPTS